MKNEKILKKAIEKAIKNGWKFGNYFLEELFEEDGEWELYDLESTLKVGYGQTIWFIFSHDFAKAFWKNNGNSIISGVDLHTRKRSGEDKYYIEDSNGAMTISWQYYLQVMVLEEDKIKYLEKFL